MSSVTPSEPNDDDQVWGTPQPKRWSSRQTLAALGVAAVIAALGGAAIYAGTSGSNAMGPGRGGPGSWHGGDGPGGPGAPGGPDAAATLHGEFVVSDGAGGYVTELTQTGVLTAVTDASITARSADGFTQTYTLAPDTRRPDTQLAVNNTVNVHAKLANGTATATAVTEGFDGGPGGPPGGMAPPPHR